MIVLAAVVIGFWIMIGAQIMGNAIVKAAWVIAMEMRAKR